MNHEKMNFILELPTVIKFPILILFSFLYLLLLSFIYVYLIDLNPFLILNIFIWILFCILLVIPISLLSGEKWYLNLIISIAICAVTLYFVYGIKSSIFMFTVEQALYQNGSMWLPKVNFTDIINTLFSPNEYIIKLDFFSQNSNLNVS